MHRHVIRLVLLLCLAACVSGLRAQSSLEITGSPPSDATVGQGYGYQFSAAGGSPPYSWSVDGLPSGIGVDAYGLLNGTPDIAGNYSLVVTVTDSSGNSASTTYPFTVLEGKALQILTTSLPAGVAGAVYIVPIYVNGGFGRYAFAVSSGALPSGVQLGSDGVLRGTFTAVGQFRFTIKVTDQNNNADAVSYIVNVTPAPILISGALTEAFVGIVIDTQFSASGGVPPYSFAVSGSLPSGTRFSNGLLTGTPNSTGTFQFTVAVTDSGGAVATRTFVVTVRAAGLHLISTPDNGQAGTPYLSQIVASGGSPPYSFTATGLPPGISLTNGNLSGTPTTAGTYTVSISVTDSTGAKATSEYRIVIAVATLSITTHALPAGTTGFGYDASLAVTGGIPPYTWTFSGLPAGITGGSNGTLFGAPVRAGSFLVSAKVTDARGSAETAALILTVEPLTLVIPPATLPPATGGATFSATLTATGGEPPYTFSATGLPAGVSFSSAGVFSGSPTSPGAATIVVAVKDSAGAAASRSYAVNVTLPPAPAVNLTNLPTGTNPGAQPRFRLALGSAYPGPVTVVLTLSFTADNGLDDPAVQFSSGGRTAQITIPAGAATATADLALQTGTVAGNITIAARLSAFLLDITPSPAPSGTIRVNPAAPVISSVTATRNATGFTVTINGYSSSRELTQANFQFTPAAGSNLQTSQATQAVDSLFAEWYGSIAAAPFGSQFSFTQPFTIQGNPQSIASVTVTLVNRVGNSSAVTVNLQ